MIKHTQWIALLALFALVLGLANSSPREITLGKPDAEASLEYFCKGENVDRVTIDADGPGHFVFKFNRRSCSLNWDSES